MCERIIWISARPAQDRMLVLGPLMMWCCDTVVSSVYLLAMHCMTKTGSSTWSRPCMHDYSCGLSLCFPPIVGPCHWGCDDWRWCFVRPVLPKIQPMSCDDDFMPIFPTLWELLLRTVFKDWIVDDGDYYLSCGNPLMAIMTYFGEIWWKSG